MIFYIDEVPVYFPYDYIYPEQYKYIKEIKEVLDGKGHCLIEMPSGTGKTIALLSITVSYQLFNKLNHRPPFKIVYCSRTVSEIEKSLKELRNLNSFIQKHVSTPFLGIGLSARRNLCINESALKSYNVDFACRRLISKWSDLHCDFYDGLSENQKMPFGVFDLEELKDFGYKNGMCPYFLARRLIPQCDCIIYTYNYLIDPNIQNIISKELGSDCVVIFDEAHNIDNSCIEALSIEIKRATLDNSTKLLKKVEEKIKNLKKENKKILEEEYKKVKNEKVEPTEGTIPYFYSSEEKNYEFAPGNLRNSVHFVSLLKRLVEFFKTKLKTTHLTTETPSSFCQSLRELTYIEKSTLVFASQRFNILSQTLSLDIDEELSSMKKVVDFATMAALHRRGFSVIFEPFDSQAQSVFNPVLRLWCLDSSIAMKDVFAKFKNVIITSGTLSPIEIYPKILNFAPVKILEIGATLSRNSVSPLIITKGNDQMTLRTQPDNTVESTLTTSFSLRSEPSVVRNYGNLLCELSKIVPDGLVVFFPSYMYMEEIVSMWSESNTITEILKHKLIFIETPDFQETETALSNYKKACDSGRGAVLFSVARGKVSEGVDFQEEYGRCVVMIGVPFQYTESVRLKKRLEFLRKEYGVKEYEFLTFDAMRHAAQCLGRVLRNKNDYGLMVLADQRFERADKKSKLPKWILSCVEPGNCNLSVDMAVNIGKRFFREMAQKVEGHGVSLLKEEDLKKMGGV